MALVTPRTVFIHVPKTGGSSVRAMLAAAGVPCRESGPFEIEDHYGLPELRAAHPELLVDRLSFGFVRHPVAWLKSRWAWAVVSGFASKMLVEPAAAAHWMADCWNADFDFVRFACNALELHPGIATRTMSRALGLCTASPVDYMARVEDGIGDQLGFIMAKAGETVPDFLAFARGERKREKVAASLENFAGQCRLPRYLELRIMDAEKPLCERFGYD